MCGLNELRIDAADVTKLMERDKAPPHLSNSLYAHYMPAENNSQQKLPPTFRVKREFANYRFGLKSF
jgi:hypothetical protein